MQLTRKNTQSSRRNINPHPHKTMKIKTSPESLQLKLEAEGNHDLFSLGKIAQQIPTAEYNTDTGTLTIHIECLVAIALGEVQPQG